MPVTTRKASAAAVIDVHAVQGDDNFMHDKKNPVSKKRAEPKDSNPKEASRLRTASVEAKAPEPEPAEAQHKHYAHHHVAAFLKLQEQQGTRRKRARQKGTI
jgi:hypothetical protein